MNKRQKAAHARAIIVGKAVFEAWAKLPESMQPAPDFNDYVDLYAQCLTADANGKNVRRRARLPKGAHARVEVLFERLQWHIGGRASLYGPMMSSLRVSRDDWDQIDTFAAVLGHLAGRQSASTQWARALGQAA